MKYIFIFIYGVLFGQFLKHIGVPYISFDAFIAWVFISIAFIYGTYNQ